MTTPKAAYAEPHPPPCEDCAHPKDMVDVSKLVAFRLNCAIYRCRACGQYWEMVGRDFKEASVSESGQGK